MPQHKGGLFSAKTYRILELQGTVPISRIGSALHFKDKETEVPEANVLISQRVCCKEPCTICHTETMSHTSHY